MRIAAIVLVIIGGLLSAGLGAKWLSDFNTYKDQVKAVAEMSKSFSAATADKSASNAVDESLKEIDKLKTCGILLIIGGLLSIVMVFLAGKIKMVSGIVIILAGIVPVILSPASLIVTFLVILGGVFTLIAKPKMA
jgi:hypothetical protein